MDYIETKMNGLKFKRTTEHDTPVILEFIKQIAIYEKMLDKEAIDKISKNGL